MNIGIITGSGFYDFPELENPQDFSVSTPFGKTSLSKAEAHGHSLFFLARHQSEHKSLPNMINHRANIFAMKEQGVGLIISTSIMGILKREIPLGELLLFNDFYFPDNRLPSGEICTFFTQEAEKGRGHYIFGSPFSATGNDLAAEVAGDLDIPVHPNLIYAYGNGPRFNSRSEINAFRNLGAGAVSQSAAPEAVLAGECEIGYLLLGFGVDYGNGVSEEPTPIEVLNSNMAASKGIFSKTILGIIEKVTDQAFFDRGFVYRFD